MRKWVAAVSIAALGFAAVSCASTTDTPDAAPRTLPATCTATPGGGFGLTKVEVSPAAGHPAGAQAITWSYAGKIPTSTVLFTWTSGGIQRAVKLNDGTVIANYVFHQKAAHQDNIDMPPTIEGSAVRVVVPAANAADLGESWQAAIEVDGESVGQCAPS